MLLSDWFIITERKETRFVRILSWSTHKKTLKTTQSSFTRVIRINISMYGYWFPLTPVRNVQAEIESIKSIGASIILTTFWPFSNILNFSRNKHLWLWLDTVTALEKNKQTNKSMSDEHNVRGLKISTENLGSYGFYPLLSDVLYSPTAKPSYIMDPLVSTELHVLEAKVLFCVFSLPFCATIINRLCN